MTDDLEFQALYDAVKEEVRKALVRELELEIQKATGQEGEIT